MRNRTRRPQQRFVVRLTTMCLVQSVNAQPDFNPSHHFYPSLFYPMISLVIVASHHCSAGNDRPRKSVLVAPDLTGSAGRGRWRAVPTTAFPDFFLPCRCSMIFLTPTSAGRHSQYNFFMTMEKKTGGAGGDRGDDNVAP